MKKNNFLVIYMIAIVIGFLHLAGDLNATSNLESLSYEQYPKPLSKPYQCSKSSEVTYDMYLNKKQIAAAALGLYFGIKQATAPQIKTKDLKSLCV